MGRKWDELGAELGAPAAGVRVTNRKMKEQSGQLDELALRLDLIAHEQRRTNMLLYDIAQSLRQANGDQALQAPPD